MTARVAVVGGGITGLALALRLLDAGARATVFDASPEFGGLSATASLPGGVRWDRFYHVIAGSDRDLVALVEELGLGAELHWQRSTQGIYLGGGVHPLVSPLDLLRLPGLSLLDKWRLGWFALRGHQPLPDAVLDGTTAAAWARARCGARAFERFWAPLLRCKLGDAAASASARFLHATLRRLRGARGDSGRERFGWVRGGYRAILDALVARLRARGVELCPGARVRSVRATATGVDVHTDAGVRAFDRAAATLANPLLADVVADLPAATAAALRDCTYLGAAVTVVAGRTPLSGHYILNLCDPRLAITGIIEMTAVVDRRETGGLTLVYLPRYAVRDSELFLQPDDAIAQRALADLACVFPATADGWQIGHAVHRARLIQPVPIAGVPAAVPPRVVVPGRVFCVNHAQLPGGALNNNDCVALATAAAPAIAAPAPLPVTA
jgi:protoporphyrinogen oxidase